MKILVLCGPSGSGKTSSLKMLIDELKTEGVEIKSCSHIETEHGDGDVRVVINWHNRRVGICTGGDTAPIIEDNFRFLQDNSCDIGISGLRQNDKQWPLFQALVSHCEEVPQFIWKLKGEKINPRKWDNEAIDRVAVGQLRLMLGGGL